MNISKNVKEMIEYPQEGIMSKKIIKEDTKDIGLFCMAKGTDISNHTSIKPGFVYVVEGKGVFGLENEKIIMEPGVFIFLDANAVHSLKAEDNTSFILGLI